MKNIEHKKLEVEYLSPSILNPYEGNSRIHSEMQIKKLYESIWEYGMILPILIDENNVIISGHAIFNACKILEFTEIPCVSISHLNEAQKIACSIALNRLTEDSTWDKLKLKTEMLKLRNLGLELTQTGFEKREILRLRLDIADEPKDEDSMPKENKKIISQVGDIWILGDHRLICGSCTDRDTVNKLLAGARPHLMITDPPYGVKYNPEWRNDINDTKSARTGKVLNDDRDDWREAWELFQGDVAYVWHASLHGRVVAESLEANDFILRAQIVWVKPNFALGRGDYHWQHEVCWYAVRKDTENTECPELVQYCSGYEACVYAVRKNCKSHWQGSRSESTLWQIDFKNQDTQTTHGTQKPVECMRRPMLNNSQPNEIIYEPFSGSGTTIIAAESCRRKCYAIELNPEYVDMAVRRWQDYTNRAAILEGDGRTFEEIAVLRGEAVNV